MFTGLYPLISQDSFTLVSLTFKAGLLGNEQVQSSVHRLPTCLASKRRKTTKLLCVKELSGTPQKPDACRFHCRYREGIEITNPRKWAAFAFGEGLKVLVCSWLVRQEGCELWWRVMLHPFGKAWGDSWGWAGVWLKPQTCLHQADEKCLCSCWWPQQLGPWLRTSFQVISERFNLI